MKIAQSDVALASSYNKSKEVKEEERLVKWDRPEDAPNRAPTAQFSQASKDAGSLEELPLDPKLMSIVRALEALTGKKMNIGTYKNTPAKGDAPKRVGWGVDYSYSKTEINSQNLSFAARGNVTTQDGQKIDFQLAFEMNKTSISQESLAFKAGDALIDPLVLNFGGNQVQITNVKHNFDLNLDGKEDEINFVGEGSGFLALDKNNDGVINDGSELFGPKSGNGFSELAQYDSDNNGWIDENDAVFEKLKIWTKDANGEMNLYSLKDKDVGALYLQNVSTKFDLDQEGVLKQSSIFLGEHGGVGTLQEIDLKI
jgi:hypothetical protein